jgi:hypothetical protein
MPQSPEREKVFPEAINLSTLHRGEFKMDLPQWSLMPELLERAKRKPNHIVVRDHAADIKDTAA